MLKLPLGPGAPIPKPQHRSDSATAPVATCCRHKAGDRPFAITSTTVAEVRFGAELAGWGSARHARLEQRIARSRIVWPGPELIDVYVKLLVQCIRSGHPLGQKLHEADRWIAATAMWLGVPLVAHDRIFTDVAGLDLLTHLRR